MKTLNLLLAFSLFFVGCGKQQEPKISRSITLNLQEGDPPSLNPYVGVDLRSRCLFLSLFEPLMRRGGDGTLQPAAAESVEISPDKTIYTFHIRNHHWSNAEPVTSYHFKEAWKFALDPETPCVRADLFYPIKNAEEVKKSDLPLEALRISCPDPKTLVVELEHPTPYFLDLTASSFFLPLYSPTIKEPLIFNGPYVVGEHIPDESLAFQKNPSYWDARSVQIDTIHFFMIRDPMTALAMFEKGELDVVGDPFSTLPFDVVPSLRSSEKLESKIVSRIFYLLINTDSYPLNNTKLRKALGLSIDRDLFTQHLFFGQLPTLSLLPKPLSMLNLQEIHEDSVILFEEAMKEMGLTRETFPTLTLSYAELAGQKQMATFIQANWKKILGIDVNLKCSEWNVHSADLKSKNYQIGALHLTTLYQDPMFFFDLFRDEENPSNYCKWESPIFQEYLDHSEHVTNLEERNAYLRAAEQYLLDEMPAIPLFTHNFQYLKKSNVDIALTDLGIYDFKAARKR